MKNEKKIVHKIELGYCPDCIVREVCIAILKLYCKNRREGWGLYCKRSEFGLKLYCNIGNCIARRHLGGMEDCIAIQSIVL